MTFHYSYKNGQRTQEEKCLPQFEIKILIIVIAINYNSHLT